MPILVPSFLITVTVLMSTITMRGWEFQEWVRTSAEFHQQNAFVGPIAAAAATYWAGRLTPPQRVFAQPFAARNGHKVVILHLGTLMTAFLISYSVGFIPIVAATVRLAEYGGPAPLVIASGYLGVMAATAFGYFIGVIGRTALLAPVSFVLMFGVAVLGTGGDTFSALVPVLHITPSLGSVETVPFVSYRLAFLVLVIVSFVLTCVGIVKRQRSGTRFPPLRTLVALPLVVLLVIPPLVHPPALFAFEVDPPRVCLNEQGVEYCVHEGHRSQLSNIVSAVDPLIKIHGSVSDVRIVDEALRGAYVNFDDRMSVYAMSNFIWYPVDPFNSAESSIRLVSSHLSGLARCRQERKYDVSADLASDLEQWLRTSGSTYGENVFQGRTVEVVKTWIAQHKQAIETCSLTASQLP
ncbi:hypothetical protein [Actinokineospora iranica]|uniref:hypothetical protein n=1 Tax=Actinokineospora iranica TaxID=1271860 RepID=UPI000B83F98E|nr:hypothetical protein [Actinokineospora iranica]